MNYTLSDYDYDLPDRLIAQEPAHPRDHARLLVYDRDSSQITDTHFHNLPEHLRAQTTLAVNNSKVEKCRLLFDGGKKEIFVLDTINPTTVKAMVRPGKKFKKGRTISLNNDIMAEVLDIDEDGLRILKLNPPLTHELYESHKHTPFPPYIQQNEALAEEYQTIYARPEGSKAAPTAGLHFTEALWNKIGDSGISRAQLTLHVGLGTFAPVKEENIDAHTMHSEWYRLDTAAVRRLNSSSHITAVGTTSMRMLEANRQKFSQFKSEKADTDIFIRPGYAFRAVDSLITNFHLPKSTLLMLVAAFMGYDEMRRVYRHAIEQEYRFYSFGDAMLIL
jgi:S-adenosylmethionine:tRNA ribosyltransferase-isomerase